MSIATLNKFKKELKERITHSNKMLSYYEEYKAKEAATILDLENQFDDVSTAIQILKMHKKKG